MHVVVTPTSGHAKSGFGAHGVQPASAYAAGLQTGPQVSPPSPASPGMPAAPAPDIPPGPPPLELVPAPPEPPVAAPPEPPVLEPELPAVGAGLLSSPPQLAAMMPAATMAKPVSPKKVLRAFITAPRN